MFYQYEIINNGYEDILYLYLDMKYEFSNELSFKNDMELGRRCKNFIKSNNINFKGNKVFLIVDDITVKVLNLNNINNTFIIDNKYSCDSFMINIKLDDNSLCEISLREFLLSSLLSIYETNIHSEVLKAICILYNTYCYKTMRDNNYIYYNDYISYKPLKYYKDSIYNYDDVLIKLNYIISEVNGMFLSYNNDYILPFIHYSNSGCTFTNDKYPYLSSVKSLWDMASPYYINILDLYYSELNNKYDISINKDSNIYITDKKICLGNKLFTLEEFKNTFNLKSTDIYIIINNEFIRIITKGCGNSYGLSIYGSNEIANNGSKYFNILKYYFPKTTLYKYVKELS